MTMTTPTGSTAGDRPTGAGAATGAEAGGTAAAGDRAGTAEAAGPGAPIAATGADLGGQLMDRADTDRFDERWRGVEDRFAVDPVEALRLADALAGDLLETLTRVAGTRRDALADLWRTGDEETGDDDAQRAALHAYRRLVVGIIT
jgi:hypothetical protein